MTPAASNEDTVFSAASAPSACAGTRVAIKTERCSVPHRADPATGTACHSTKEMPSVSEASWDNLASAGSGQPPSASADGRSNPAASCAPGGVRCEPQREPAQQPSWVTLMMRAQDGDRAAFSALLTAATPMIRSLARHYCETPEDAEQAVQQALLSVYALRHTYSAGRPFLPWLAAIAAQRTIDRLQHQYRRGVRLRTVTRSAAAMPMDLDLFDCLPSRQRQILQRLAAPSLTRRTPRVAAMPRLGAWLKRCVPGTD